MQPRLKRISHPTYPVSYFEDKPNEIVGNTRISDKDIARKYVTDMLWEAENPDNVGFRDGKYYAYTDEDLHGNVHTNIGPGLNKTAFPNIDYSKGYTREELDNIAEEFTLQNLKKINDSLSTMKGGQYNGVRDTLSMGPMLVLTDIAYNVRSENNKNMPSSFPKLVNALATGDLESAKKETRTGSTRRQNIRNSRLIYR